MRGLLFGIALALMIFACAHPPMPSQPPAVQEITMLWGQIRQWRHEAKMDLEPAAASVIAMRSQTVQVAIATCPDGHAVPPACNDVCDPADAICDNAERICGLAGDLDDTQWASWAKEKCDSAKASCKEAKKRCCECEHGAEP
ncbi:MAG TPA: hypothetical protein VL463_03400 [Kofleriaceae bacterium]|nr:hypothetical protein [Kofleriaceae bacterium]